MIMRLSGARILLLLLPSTTALLLLPSVVVNRGPKSCYRNAISTPTFLLAAKGFGAAPKKPKKVPSKKQILKNLEKTYGGTSPEDIAKGTQRLIDQRLAKEPSHIQIALQIYQQLQQWNHRLSQMPVYEQTKIPVDEMEGAKRAQTELERLMKEHDFTERTLHNLVQQATWDASADAKTARSITGQMPVDTQRRVQKGCDLAVEMATKISDKPTILDVGCGYGVLVPFLKKAGLSDKQIFGIDLSSEMIRNAASTYPECNFSSGDFYAYDPSKQFEAVVFCSSLHDLPNMMEATIPKARDLLLDGGALVILHAQGASHVQSQVRANPTMVQRGLPSEDELLSIPGFKLMVAPASAKSQEENRYGYLAVLQRVDDEKTIA